MFFFFCPHMSLCNIGSFHPLFLKHFFCPTISNLFQNFMVCSLKNYNNFCEMLVSYIKYFSDKIVFKKGHSMHFFEHV